jgi:hypothetical protein
MNLEYILTEDNTMLGLVGKCVDYAGYKQVYYANRCLFMKISPDHDFRFEATFQREGSPKVYYKFQTANELNRFIDFSGVIELRKENDLIYKTIEKIGTVSYINIGRNYFTFKRLK